jgi:hypothetical protein
MVTGYEEFGFRVTVASRSQELSLLHVVQTGYEAHPASYPLGSRDLSLGHEADHTPPSIAEVKKTWIHPLPYMPSWCSE